MITRDVARIIPEVRTIFQFNTTLASSAGNSEYTDHEESEDEKRRRKMWWSCLQNQKSKRVNSSFTLVDQCLHPGFPGAPSPDNFFWSI